MDEWRDVFLCFFSDTGCHPKKEQTKKTQFNISAPLFCSRSVEVLLLRAPSHPDDRGGGCEGSGGAGVEVQVDHGVVGCAQAAKRRARAHLSVPQAL